jgi:hypothetical protein
MFMNHRMISCFSLLLLLPGLFLVPAHAQNQPMHKPFDGSWIALQGPSCPDQQNHHCNTLNQAFAYDFVPIAQNGSLLNCMGMPIRSPADGIVIEVLDGIPDFASPLASRQHLAGNHIVIQKSPTEFILLAHFRQGSVRVSQNQTVSRGDILGDCGNSGRSTGPHLHLHMQSSPNILDFRAQGLPMNFGPIDLWNGASCVTHQNVVPGKNGIIC